MHLAELHCHLEGTMRPELVRKLATRHGITLPDGLFDDDGHYVWRDFLHFLEVYDLISGVIRDAADYRDVTYDYLTACAAEGAIYVEVSASPDHAAAGGMNYVEMIAGIAQGIDDAKAATGIEARIILICVRHFGADRAQDVARTAARHPHKQVVGLGLGGDELSGRAADFAPAFALAAEAGLGLTAHAGEWAGPDDIRETLAHLPVSRIGHGVRAVEDPGLVREIADRGLVLEVCPGSNIATGIYPDHQGHPLRTLLAAGCRVTLNSDDPPFFHTSIGGEYAAARTHLGLSEAVLNRMTRTAIEAGFADPETRAALLQRLD